jgi:hypothetical protein
LLLMQSSDFLTSPTVFVLCFAHSNYFFFYMISYVIHFPLFGLSTYCFLHVSPDVVLPLVLTIGQFGLNHFVSYRFQAVRGTIGERMKKKKTGKETQLKYYKVMVVSTLMSGSETWVLTERSLRSSESAEMRFLTLCEGYIKLDKISNHDIRSEFGIPKLKNTYR